ncbi:hypothetical protein AX15_004775 [Amanita polypyramis BW_CC]|nr:hypothetical protein AX15_004775 [Amanita polypyramis BW_CC]
MVLKALLYGLLVFGVTCVAALDFTNAKWIWKTANYIVPPYERADFRYDFTSPGGKSASSAQILITGDNNYTLWVNGELIGGGNDWQTSQSYCVVLNPVNNVFAAETVNFPPNNNPSVFISAIQVNFVGGSSQIIVSDASWRANNATTGFQVLVSTTRIGLMLWSWAMRTALRGIPTTSGLFFIDP